MKLSRRQALTLTGGTIVLAASGALRTAADGAATANAIAAFTGGAILKFGRVRLDIPDIVENGNAVPVSLSVDSAMAGDDVVEAVAVFTYSNPNPEVAVFRFSAMSASADVSTRIRLAESQDVIAIARMADGTCFTDTRSVSVTIGGCGS